MIELILLGSAGILVYAIYILYNGMMPMKTGSAAKHSYPHNQVATAVNPRLRTAIILIGAAVLATSFAVITLWA